MPLSPEQKDLIARMDASRGPDRERFLKGLTPEEKSKLNRGLDIEHAETQYEALAAVPPIVEIASPHALPPPKKLNNQRARPIPGAMAASSAPQPQPAATGRVATERRSKRIGDLTAVYFYYRNGIYRQRFRHSDLFVAWLQDQLRGRDPRDRENVAPAELGKSLDLRFADFPEIERKKNAWRSEESRRKGQPPPRGRFYLTTILPCDMSATELAHVRRKNRPATTAIQPTENKMQTETETQSKPISLLEEQMARTRAQIDAVRKVLTDGEWHKRSELLKHVCHNAPWSAVHPSKRYQTLIDRLKMISGEIENKEAPGPRGSILKLVRRRDPNPLH